MLSLIINDVHRLKNSEPEPSEPRYEPQTEPGFKI
jgi:hypothetical protein